jgi:acyl-CoA thioester hydrolase
VEERGIFLPVREATCRYLAPARYDDIIHIRTGLSGQTRASLYFTYEITNEDRSTLLTRGSTQHAVINDQGRPVRIPQWFAEMLTGGQIRKKQDE